MKKLGAIVIFAAIWGIFTLAPAAQSGLTITAPASDGFKFPAGPDYATDVLGDAWDMSNPEDIGSDPNEHKGWAGDFGVANGLAGGTTAKQANGSIDSWIPLLYRGFYNIVNPGRSGKRFPIDSGFYKKLSYKLRSDVAQQAPQIYWFRYPWSHPSGLVYGVKFLPNAVAGTRMYSVDLTSQTGGTAWSSGPMAGLRFDPNSVSVGHRAYLDWARLTRSDAETAAKTTISWSTGTGTSTIDVIDSSNVVMNVASGVAGTSYVFNYGVLPPGQYTIRVTRGTAAATRTFSINNPPLVKVTDPDEAGGTDDYATTVMNNAWDMNSSADTPLLRNISGASYSSGAFHGTNTNGDPSIFLLKHVSGMVPIDTNRYRYLTYRFSVDGAYNLGMGSVARFFWGSDITSTADSTTTTQDIIVWPGTHTYSVDLSALHFGADGALEQTGARKLWTASPVRWFRFDPHEFAQARSFHVHDVRLTAIDESSNGVFRVRWTGSDADGDAATVSLYYDTNKNPNDGRTLIAQGVSLGSGQFDWSTANVTPGTYWIYALATDGLDARGFYSTGQVRVSAGGSIASDPVANIDAPASGAQVTQPFTLSGFAIDRGSSSGTGVNAVEVYAQPLSGGTQIALGAATYGTARSDIGSAYGSRFTNSGFSKSISSLGAGSYELIMLARSTVTNSFSITDSVNVTVLAPASGSKPLIYIDTPRANAIVTLPFTVAGWAADRGAPSGTGVTAIEMYAQPLAGGNQIALGAGTYGIARPDVGNALGSRYTNTGYSKSIASLGPGSYEIIVRARSTVTNAFTISKTVSNITVLNAATVASQPIVWVDAPVNGSTVSNNVVVAGWAIDRASESGTGMNRVEVFRRAAAGGSETLVGVATYGLQRNDLANVYGSIFRYSGYRLTATIPDGTYDLLVRGRSALTGLWTTRTVRVTIQ
jgi:hypothetical protein